MDTKIRYSEEDISLIKRKIEETGYDPGLDIDVMGCNFHAGDDDAYAIVSASDLSQQAVDDILSAGTMEEVREKLPKNFDPEKLSFKFKWNMEWGDWSDVIYDGEKVWDFASGLEDIYYTVDYSKLSDTTIWRYIYPEEGRWPDDLREQESKIIGDIRALRPELPYGTLYEMIQELEKKNKMPGFDRDGHIVGLVPLSYDFLDLLFRFELNECDPYQDALKKAEYIILKYAVSIGVSIIPDAYDKLTLDNLDEWFNNVAMTGYIDEVTKEVVYDNRNRFQMRFKDDGSFDDELCGSRYAVRDVITPGWRE